MSDPGVAHLWPWDCARCSRWSLCCCVWCTTSDSEQLVCNTDWVCIFLFIVWIAVLASSHFWVAYSMVKYFSFPVDDLSESVIRSCLINKSLILCFTMLRTIVLISFSFKSVFFPTNNQDPVLSQCSPVVLWQLLKLSLSLLAPYPYF